MEQRDWCQLHKLDLSILPEEKIFQKVLNNPKFIEFYLLLEYISMQKDTIIA